jgi:hypothetical protein
MSASVVEGTLEITGAHIIERLWAVLPDRAPIVRCHVGERVLARIRPDVVGFRPERVEIEDADHFDVHDIRVGNRSQFARHGAIPGSLFAKSAIEAFVSFDTLQTAMDLDIVVEYKGPIAEGVELKVRVHGLKAVS